MKGTKYILEGGLLLFLFHQRNVTHWHQPGTKGKNIADSRSDISNSRNRLVCR